jgi:hypothetical protein
VANVETCITIEDLVDGEIVLRAGKKRYHRIVAI